MPATLVVGVFWLPPTISAGDWSRVAIGSALAAVTGAVMILRRYLPVAATVTATITTIAGTALGVCQDPMLAAAWCLYPLAVARAIRTRLVVVLACVLAGLAAVTGVPEKDARGVGQQLVVAVAALSVAWLLGTAAGTQIMSAQEAERARVQLDVARDVHDVVGHALGVIAAEAGVIRGLPDVDERELRGTLANMESHARKALEEMQALVSALRVSTAPHTGAQRRAPAPGTERLPALIAAARAAGVIVDADVGVRRNADAQVGAVAFRIVQEALSNVVRHAPGARCSVDVHQDGEAVMVHVRDRGPRGHCPDAEASSGGGFGLQGMRERASMVGGTMTWRNHPEGGFEVRARLPVRGAG